jgi:predicted dehydrogenase
MKITYNPDYERRVRVGFIGCGGHSYRNIFPTFQYAPVDLVAVCDLNRERAEQVGRQFGAPAVYTDYHEMLSREALDAVFIVTGYDAQGRPLYPPIATDALRAGVHAWIEKPPAASAAEIRALQQTSAETGRFVMVGFKKMFFPANVKAKSLIMQPDFGRITSITARYPQPLPPYEDRQESLKMVGFLDHIVHPYSVLKYLAGSVQSIHVERSAINGASVTAIRFASGAIGSLHLSMGQAGLSPLERTEIVGENANVIVDNNLRVTYYRGTSAGAGYGREADYYHDTETPTQFWEPEFSLGQLYNKGLFLLGYAPEVLYFCECVLNDTPPERANLADALELMHIYEAYCQPDGALVQIPHA